MIRNRNTWRFFSYRASCHECAFVAEWTRNGLGLAAQHHDRTGHSVGIDVEGAISYLNERDHQAKLAERRKA